MLIDSAVACAGCESNSFAKTKSVSETVVTLLARARSARTFSTARSGKPVNSRYPVVRAKSLLKHALETLATS